MLELNWIESDTGGGCRAIRADHGAYFALITDAETWDSIPESGAAAIAGIYRGGSGENIAMNEEGADDSDGMMAWVRGELTEILQRERVDAARPMRVRDLIAKLQDLPGNSEVYLGTMLGEEEVDVAQAEIRRGQALVSVMTRGEDLSLWSDESRGQVTLPAYWMPEERRQG